MRELKESKSGSGTIIVLVHLRTNGLTDRLELDPTQDDYDFVFMSEQEEEKKFQLDARGPREEGKEVRLDFSLRALCEVMFLEPRMKIRIRGTKVEPVRVQTELTNMKAVTIKVEHAGAMGAQAVPGTPGGSKKQKTNPVIAYLGRHPRHAEEWQLSGTLTYQDNGLVVAYGRPGIAGSLGDKLGVLLICSLPSSEFKVNNTKTDFEPKSEKSGSMRYPKIRAAFTREFKKYVDECERDVASASQAVAREEYNAASGVATDCDWMQCESCGRWRLFSTTVSKALQRAGKTPQQFKEYKVEYANKMWCCWFKGSPVEKFGSKACTEVPCDFENFANLFDDTTVGQVDLRPASYSQNDSSEDDDDEPRGLKRSPSGNAIQLASPAVEHPPTRRDVADALAELSLPRSISTDVKILKPADHEQLKILKQRCAEGGFCYVHEASFYGEPIALKELKNKCDTADLIKEAGNLSKLKHAAIPQLRFVDPDGCRIGLEWVDGTTLDACESHTRGTHWSSWVSQMVSALQYIHSQDILHNDLRLSNLMVTADAQHVKLIDFGLAKLQKADTTFSVEPNSVRSAKYKCPTVARQGHTALGKHVDVYSLGICVLELATGKIDEVWGQGFIDTDVLRLIMNSRTTDDQLHKQLNIAASDLGETLRKIVEGCITVSCFNRLGLDRVARLMEDITVGPKVQFVYHVLEPQDQLEFNESGEFVRLTRLPGGSADQTLAYHVGKGSQPDFRGRFVSCTQSAEWAIHFWSLQKAQTDISYPILKIDTAKIAEASRVDLTTKEACRRHNLSNTETNYAYDASEVVFTNGHSGGGIPAAAISDVFTLVGHRLECDTSHKQWHDRTKHRRPLQEMVTAAGKDKTKSFKDWSRKFLRVRDEEMNGANSFEILKEGACSIDAVVQKEGDTQSNVSGKAYGQVWCVGGGPYDRSVAGGPQQPKQKKPRRDEPAGESAASRTAVVGRLYKPSSGAALPLYLQGSDVYFEQDGQPKKLGKAGLVVDSAGTKVGKGPDAVTKTWRWDLGTFGTGGTFNKSKGLPWLRRRAGKVLADSKVTLSEPAMMVSPKLELKQEAAEFAKDHPWLRPGRLLWAIDGSRKKCADIANDFDANGFKKVMNSATCLTFCSDEEHTAWTSGSAAQLAPPDGAAAAAASAASAAAAALAASGGAANTLKRAGTFAGYTIGMRVQKRDTDDEEWSDGIVASLDPLLVTFDCTDANPSVDEEFWWNQVRPLLEDDPRPSKRSRAAAPAAAPARAALPAACQR